MLGIREKEQEFFEFFMINVWSFKGVCKYLYIVELVFKLKKLRNMQGVYEWTKQRVKDLDKKGTGKK